MKPEPEGLQADESGFGRWLQKQAGRDDSVGGLAESALKDPGWPGGESIRGLRDYFLRMGAREFLLASLDQAWKEYAATLHKDKMQSKRRQASKRARRARRSNRR